jgi:hypothetical protein
MVTSQPCDPEKVCEHGDREYVFCRFPAGNPPGQIKAFVRDGLTQRRVALLSLPHEMKVVFISLTGKKPEELGLFAGGGGW